SLAIAIAVERPMPCAADVTNAVLPFSLSPMDFVPLIGQIVARSSAPDRGLSMTDDDLCYLTAKEALKLFRARKVSPLDILKAQIARSEEINPAINCFTD